MGKNQSKASELIKQINSKFFVIKEVPQRSCVFYKKHDQEGEMMLQELRFHNKQEYNQVMRKLNIIKDLLHPDIICANVSEEANEANMCSNYYKIYVLWEHPIKTLADLIKERRQAHTFFKNEEILSILGYVIMGMSYQQRRKITHQSMCAQAILISSSGQLQNRVKVTYSLAIGRHPNSDTFFNVRCQKGIYLSPEECEQIRTQKPIVGKNTYKCDVFALGMVALQCGSLQKLNQCYIDNGTQLDRKMLNAKMRKFGERGDPFLIDLVEKMLRVGNERPDWLELESFLNFCEQNGYDFTKPNREGYQQKIRGQSAGKTLTNGTSHLLVQPLSTMKSLSNEKHTFSTSHTISKRGDSSTQSPAKPNQHLSRPFSTLPTSTINSNPQSRPNSQAGGSIITNSISPLLCPPHERSTIITPNKRTDHHRCRSDQQTLLVPPLTHHQPSTLTPSPSKQIKSIGNTWIIQDPDRKHDTVITFNKDNSNSKALPVTTKSTDKPLSVPKKQREKSIFSPRQLTMFDVIHGRTGNARISNQTGP